MTRCGDIPVSWWRRHVSCLLALWALTGLLPASALPAVGGDYQVRQLAPHTFVWIADDIMDQSGDPNFNRAGNAGFLITSGGVVVVNTTNNPFHAREVLYEIRRRTEIPVRLVIDTGSQGDQVLGNEVFAEQGATIVATAAAGAHMRAYQANLAKRLSYDPELPAHMRGIHFTFPNQAVGEKTSFNMGGEEIRVISVQRDLRGSGEGDAVVFLPRERVLFLGDLYVNGYVPQVDSRDIQYWASALGSVEKWNVTDFVPGHGNPGTEKDLANFQGFLEWFHARVQAGIRQRKSLPAVENQLLSSSAFNLLAPDLAPRAIAAVYHQVLNALGAQGVRPASSAVSPTLQPKGGSSTGTGGAHSFAHKGTASPF